MASATLAHIVYFSLKDNSHAAIARQVELCKTYLADHPGTLYFSVGTRTPDLNREVNDKDFDVGLHVIFQDRASHDRYQTDPRHLKFIEESKPNWAKARVFDSNLA